MQAFRYRRFAALVILQCVRWYSKYTISYRQVGSKKATVAIARKLAVILHRLLRDGTEFRWSTKQGQAA